MQQWEHLGSMVEDVENWLDTWKGFPLCYRNLSLQIKVRGKFKYVLHITILFYFIISLGIMFLLYHEGDNLKTIEKI